MYNDKACAIGHNMAYLTLGKVTGVIIFSFMCIPNLMIMGEHLLDYHHEVTN